MPVVISNYAPVSLVTIRLGVFSKMTQRAKDLKSNLRYSASYMVCISIFEAMVEFSLDSRCTK